MNRRCSTLVSIVALVWWLGLFAAIFLTQALLSGCGLFDSHVKQMDILNGLAASASERLADGSLSSIHANGQALNPGITVEAAIVYRASAFYDGLAGAFSIASQGQLGREVNTDQIWAIMRDTSMTDADRRAAIEQLLSQVVAALTTPPTSQPAGGQEP